MQADIFKILVLTLLEETNQAMATYLVSKQKIFFKKVLFEKTKLVLKLVCLVKSQAESTKKILGAL